MHANCFLFRDESAETDAAVMAVEAHPGKRLSEWCLNNLKDGVIHTFCRLHIKKFFSSVSSCLYVAYPFILLEQTEGDDVEIGCPITCGDSKAVLLVKKFVCPGINVKCVKVGIHCSFSPHWSKITATSEFHYYSKTHPYANIFWVKTFSRHKLYY